MLFIQPPKTHIIRILLGKLDMIFLNNCRNVKKYLHNWDQIINYSAIMLNSNKYFILYHITSHHEGRATFSRPHRYKNEMKAFHKIWKKSNTTQSKICNHDKLLEGNRDIFVSSYRDITYFITTVVNSGKLVHCDYKIQKAYQTRPRN